MPKVKREIRIRQLPNCFRDGKWQTKPQPLVRLGGVGNWAVVRDAEYRNACPFCIGEKDWAKLPVQEQVKEDEHGH